MVSTAAVVSPHPHPHHRGHRGSRGKIRADQADVEPDERIPMLLEVPGWRRIRRFRLVRAMDAPGSEFLSLHEPAGPEVLEDPSYQAAIGTPWRDRVAASALRPERRVSGLRHAIGA
jgi:hypothetical protein